MSAARSCNAPFASWIAVLAVLGLVACQSTTFAPSFPPVPAPTLAVGDHWEYQITDNLRRGLVTMLEADVVSISSGIASVRLVYNDQNGRTESRAEIDANGGLVAGALKGEESRRFQVPIQMYDFPLERGRPGGKSSRPSVPIPNSMLRFSRSGTSRGNPWSPRLPVHSTRRMFSASSSSTMSSSGARARRGKTRCGLLLK